MARLSVGQKAQRVVRFLMGLGNVRVAAHLRRHGFTEHDRVEGYELLKQLTSNRLDALPPPPADKSLIERLDAWENQWFPIAGASLHHRYPEAHGRLFLNLSQTEGPEVVLSVGTFVERLDELAASDDPVDGNAFAHLELRGLTPDVIDDARQLLGRIGHIPDEPLAPAVTPEELERREEALWAWYIEWSTIARTTIKNRNLLRQLGFLQSKQSAEADDAPTEVEPDADVGAVVDDADLAAAE